MSTHVRSSISFQQTYTSSLPKSLLLGVHQRGLHLIEAKSFVSSNNYFEAIRDSQLNGLCAQQIF